MERKHGKGGVERHQQQDMHSYTEHMPVRKRKRDRDLTTSSSWISTKNSVNNGKEPRRKKRGVVVLAGV